MTNDDTTNPSEVERPLDRRLLLRGGAVLAGAAGVTVIGAAMGASKAEAADGQFMVLGQPNTGESSTIITVGLFSGSESAALILENASGPALRLTPTGDGYNGGLQSGEIASTSDGLEIGVGQGDNTDTTWLATGLDLDQIPFTIALDPSRLVDTRIPEGRGGIMTTSVDAFDSSFRLKAGAWMDVGVVPAFIYGVDAAFLNITAVSPVRAGHITAYPPGDRPTTSTLNFIAGQNTANGAFIRTDIAPEEPKWFVVRIHTNAVTHVLVDLTGVTVRGLSGVSNSKLGSAGQRSSAKTDRMKRTISR